MSLVTYKPIHPDELALTGETFEETMTFTATGENSSVYSDTAGVCIYVPKSVKDMNANQAGMAHKVLVFFTANSSTKDTGFNDTLNHGLRAAADKAGFVLIVLPSVPGGDHATVPFDKPDFRVFRDADIQSCLKAASLSEKVEVLRLVSHSRGHRGMTRTLMGNDNIGEKNAAERDPNTAKIKTSFVDVSKIDKLVYLDNFFPSAQRVIIKLVAAGLSNQALKVYHVTDGVNITDKTIVKDMAKQFIDLVTIKDGIISIACIRYISAAIAVTAQLDNKNTKLALKIIGDATLLKVLFTNQLPQRLTLSTVQPTPTNQQDYVKFAGGLKVTVPESDLMLKFLNDEQLLRSTFRFDRKIAAHHLFVCEIASEFFM
jgi:hypothetical protein